jgi:hypothetical protein
MTRRLRSRYVARPWLGWFVRGLALHRGMVMLAAFYSLSPSFFQCTIHSSTVIVRLLHRGWETDASGGASIEVIVPALTGTRSDAWTASISDTSLDIVMQRPTSIKLRISGVSLLRIPHRMHMLKKQPDRCGVVVSPCMSFTLIIAGKPSASWEFSVKDTLGRGHVFLVMCPHSMLCVSVVNGKANLYGCSFLQARLYMSLLLVEPMMTTNYVSTNSLGF